jgi:hypothetical protein
MGYGFVVKLVFVGFRIIRIYVLCVVPRLLLVAWDRAEADWGEEGERERGAERGAERGG